MNRGLVAETPNTTKALELSRLSVQCRAIAARAQRPVELGQCSSLGWECISITHIIHVQ